MQQRLRVLQSFPEPRPTTNPYIVMLRRALDELPEVELRTFSWRHALLGRYDVFHVHWPEILLDGRGALRTLVRRVLVALLVLRLWSLGTPLVRTAHNLRPHASVGRVDAALLRGIERRTTLVVRLNEQTPVPGPVPAVTIPHGHYRDWFAAHPRPGRTRSRLVFVGLIRPYKNVPALIAAFRQVLAGVPDARLDVAGRPAEPQLAEELRRAAAGVPEVCLRLAHLSDAELVEVVSRAEYVALPYREMHNSGAALMALSLDRPVLLPDNEVTAQLAEEVGDGWVLRFAGELTGEQLVTALERARRIPAGERPDLSRREWHTTGRDHLAAYRRAVAVRTGRRRGRR